MAKGGARLGAGRKPRAPNKATKAREEFILSSGIGPLMVMIDNMRHAYDKALEAEDRLKKNANLVTDIEKQALAAQIMYFRHASHNFARDAAPYVHPRLAQVDHSGEVRIPTVMTLPEVQHDKQAWLTQHRPKTPTIQ